MISTREFNKQDSDHSTLVKNHHVESTPNHNSCGGCNSCHQMTGSPIFGGSDDGVQGSNIQKPCATNFFQRNLGNSYMQSAAGNLQTSGASSSGNGTPMIQKKCSCGGSCSGCSGEEELQGIQTKLTIGSPNDVYEQEADRVAEQVMRMPEPSMQPEKHTNTGINVQKLSSYDGGTLGSDQDIKLNQSGGRSLTSSTRNFMEPRFGADFGHVRLHTDHDAHQTASQIQAKAFTNGNHIWLGKVENEQNKRLIAHELTHVVQQTMASGQFLPSPYDSPEREALGNSRLSAAGLESQQLTSCTEGVIQRQAHEEEEAIEGEFTTGRGFELSEEGVTNRFGFNASLEIPLLDLRLGPVAFLNQLEISAEGSTESEEPLPLGITRIDTLETEIALTLLSLEMERLRRTSLGDFSFEAGAGLSASASAAVSPGEGVESGAGVGLSANAEGSFLSRPFRVSGEEVRFTAAIGTEASANFNLGDPPGINIEGSASAGLVAPGIRGEPFVRAVLSGSIDMVTIGSGVEVESSGINISLVAGFTWP